MPRIITAQDLEIERLRLALMGCLADELHVNAEAATRTANARAALNAALDARAATLGAQHQAFLDDFCLSQDEPVAPYSVVGGACFVQLPLVARHRRFALATENRAVRATVAHLMALK